ncbi:hypothetical protein B9Z51_10280 [Limnohabitans sp. T6-5]|uniref:PAS domain-containing hybrid sensor histidine kinase/response regulator n=1 Tax=Limnohabitans sp. T6-5 TaxID=1100724 RepID=UPI000D33BBA0|nr:PAS domain-containing hybrid sensor histidine kinase/response regulator [Limnohabitans sp. T6-5]PUE09275.1 hypothetical protein B9Z51_10280 [Limnohabitans sp. T6-5]
MILILKNILQRFFPTRSSLSWLDLEQMPFGVVVVASESGRVLQVNERFARFVGRTRPALVQSCWSQLTAKPDQEGPAFDGDSFRASSTETPVVMAQSFIKPDGLEVRAELSLLTKHMGSGGEAVFILMVRDMAESFQAQDQLRVSEQRHRLLADSARDVVWTMSPLGQITYVSPAVEQLRGITPEEAMQQSIDETLTPESRDVSLRYFQEVALAIQEGHVPQSFRGELEYWRKDGSRFWTEVLSFPLMGAQGELVEIVGVTRDINERRLYEDGLLRAREVAEKANKAKSEFLAHISHEIRTPMSAILSLTELLLSTPLNEKQHEWLKKSKSAGSLLLGIINDILDLSKMESGALVLPSLPLNVQDVLQQVTDLVTDACAFKGLGYEVWVDPKVPHALLGDSQRLAQALLNLVSNAVKFTEQGSISVRVEDLGQEGSTECLRFVVQDTGIGLEREFQSRVFEGFVQGDNAQTRLHGGAGLGLSICKRIAQLMGGDVGVESMPGHGSTFWMTVRLARGEMAGGPVSHAVDDPAVPVDFQGIRVLLVDDNASIRDILTQLLTLAGVDADTAANGREAMAKIQSSPYALVLMDMQMPLMDGLEATRQIRQDPQYRDLPIVALTAGGFDEDRERCMAAGMNDYLSKPFEYKKLLAVFARNLNPAARRSTELLS